MVTRQATAQWDGKLKDGEGWFQTESGVLEAEYSFPTRFESAEGTNPEELLAAAQAACYSMALSAGLEKNGFEPKRVITKVKVHLEKQDAGFTITKFEIETEAQVPNIEADRFQELAEETKRTCPVSKLFSTAELKLNAKLLASV